MVVRAGKSTAGLFFLVRRNIGDGSGELGEWLDSWGFGGGSVGVWRALWCIAWWLGPALSLSHTLSLSLYLTHTLSP